MVAFELLTGKLPFESKSPHQLISDTMHNPPPSPLHLNPALDVGVEAALQRAPAKAPARRFSTASKLAGDAHG